MTFTARNPFYPPHSVSGPSLPTLFISGMMGPTILDVAALTGFRPYGEVVSAVTMGPAKTEDGQTLDCSFKGWAKFMSHYHKKKGPVTD